MIIAFFSNYMNPHQKFLSDEITLQKGVEYYFVSMIEVPEWRQRLGYPNYSDLPYVINTWKSDTEKKKAGDLAITADVAIFGTVESISYQIIRCKHTDQLSLEVSERWLKKGILNLLSPRLLRNMWYYHTLFRKKPLYKLCSSAYAAWDQYKMLSYKDRCYKWGYFTRVDDYDIEASLDDRQAAEFRLMWCARFLKLKHPEMAIRLAARLKAKGYAFTLDMYGSGVELERMQLLARQLEVTDVVRFCGNLPNDQILEQMRCHDIFLFTSDRNEGWGAVANEAMSNGCVLVGSDAIGSVPFLVKDGENGCVFKSCNLDSLMNKVEYLLNNRTEIRRLAVNGYLTMKTVWSPENAARNLMTLIDDLRNGRDTSVADGPCSKALPL